MDIAFLVLLLGLYALSRTGDVALAAALVSTIVVLSIVSVGYLSSSRRR